MQSMSMVDCDREDHTPKAALHWLSHDECWREDHVVASALNGELMLTSCEQRCWPVCSDYWSMFSL